MVGQVAARDLLDRKVDALYSVRRWAAFTQLGGDGRIALVGFLFVGPEVMGFAPNPLALPPSWAKCKCELGLARLAGGKRRPDLRATKPGRKLL